MKLLLSATLMAILSSSQTIAAPRSFSCDWTTQCRLEDGCNSGSMKFSFFIDENDEAFLQGNANLVQVVKVESQEAISFIEIVGDDTVQSTTILANGSAIHSRHTNLLGEFVESQWHGNCQYFESEK